MTLDNNLCSYTFVPSTHDPQTLAVASSDQQVGSECYHIAPVRHESNGSSTSYSVVCTDAYDANIELGFLECDAATPFAPQWKVSLLNPSCTVAVQEKVKKATPAVRRFRYSDGEIRCRFVLGVALISCQGQRDSPLARSFTCTYRYAYARTRDPPIVLAMLKIPRWFSKWPPELTCLHYNWQRIDLKDPKGLELVLLLTTRAIIDTFDSEMRERHAQSQVQRGKSPSPLTPPASAHQSPLEPFSEALLNSRPQPQEQQQQQPQRHAHHETSMDYLRQLEEQERRKIEQRKLLEEEETLRFLQAEEERDLQARSERQREIDAETQRLREIYGEAPAPPSPAPSAPEEQKTSPRRWWR